MPSACDRWPLCGITSASIVPQRGARCAHRLFLARQLSLSLLSHVSDKPLACMHRAPTVSSQAYRTSMHRSWYCSVCCPLRAPHTCMQMLRCC